MATTRVVPSLDPGEYRQPGLRLGLPSAPGNELALQRGKETLGHGVVVRIPHRAHGGAHTHFPATVTKGNAGVLAALIRVMDNVLGLARQQRHVQCLNDQIRRHVHTERPAHHFAAEHIGHHGKVHKALPGRHIGHVCHPQLIDVGGDKLALNQIGGGSLAWMAFGRHAPSSSAADAAQSSMAHEVGYAFAAGHDPLISEFSTDAGHAVGLIACLVGSANLVQQRGVGLCARTGWTALPVVKATGAHTQRLAQRADGEFGLVCFHEFVDGVNVFSLLPANQAVAFARRGSIDPAL